VLIPVQELVKVFHVRPNGVLHVGAHLAEEAPMYEEYGWQGSSKIYWVESQQVLAQELRIKLDNSIHDVKCATVWNASGLKLQFKHTNNSQSSSLLDLHIHSEKYPKIKVDNSYEVITSRLDDICQLDKFDFVALDIQGAELKALEGMGELLNEVNWIYSEVNKVELYKDCALITDIDEFLGNLGFKRVATRWAFRSGWGDALWMRNELIEHSITRTLRSKLKNFTLITLYTIRYFARKIFLGRD
jgi:FkbM family methyltransferase